MKIAADWPLPEKLIQNEIATLQAMGNNSSLGQVQAQLAGAANKKYLYYKNRDHNRTGFSFSSWLEFPASPDVTKALSLIHI